MNKREKEAREKLAKLRGPYGEAIHITKKGGRDVDNHDSATIKDGLMRRMLKQPPRTGQ